MEIFFNEKGLAKVKFGVIQIEKIKMYLNIKFK